MLLRRGYDQRYVAHGNDSIETQRCCNNITRQSSNNTSRYLSNCRILNTQHHAVRQTSGYKLFLSQMSLNAQARVLTRRNTAVHVKELKENLVCNERISNRRYKNIQIHFCICMFYYTQTVILFPGVGFQEVDRLLNDVKQSVCVCVRVWFGTLKCSECVWDDKIK